MTPCISARIATLPHDALLELAQVCADNENLTRAGRRAANAVHDCPLLSRVVVGAHLLTAST